MFTASHNRTHNNRPAYRDIVGRSLLENRNLTVHTASQEFLSFLRLYYDQENLRVYPYLTAIIDVEDGIVRGIAWDNACVFCSKDRCVENTFNFAGVSTADLVPPLKENTEGCFLEVNECDKIQSELGQKNDTAGYAAVGANLCDLNLYVVWTGTDVDGNPFQSSSSRFGAFPEARLQDRISNSLPDFSSPF